MQHCIVPELFKPDTLKAAIMFLQLNLAFFFFTPCAARFLFLDILHQCEGDCELCQVVASSPLSSLPERRNLDGLHMKYQDVAVS